MLETVLQVGREFTCEFTQDPYLCYTEHGQHAYFYNQLFSAIPGEERFTYFQDQRVCILQKEYPTHSHVGRSQRQHWDISVIRTPTESTNPNYQSFDYLRLNVIAEFGLNAHPAHLEDDIERMMHADANADHLVAFHLYRLGEHAGRLSRRDISQNSTAFASLNECLQCIGNHPVHFFYAVYNPNGESSAWYSFHGETQQIHNQ